MDNIKEEKETLDNAIKFTDSVSKALEGLKDKMSLLILESESKNEKPDRILNEWVLQANNIIKEKFEEIYEIVYEENKVFVGFMKTW